MRSLEEYLREHQSASRTLPHDVLEELMRSLMGIVERRCELLRTYEGPPGREVWRALGVMSIADAQEWTELLRVSNGEAVASILAYGAREYARIEYGLQSELVKVEVYASYAGRRELRELSAEMREWYEWLSELKEAMQRYGPAGSIARASKAPGGLGVPITTILLGSKASGEEWRGQGTLTAWTLSELWLFRVIPSPDTAYLEQRTEEHPQGRTVEKKIWRIDLNALREKPSTT